MLVVAFILLYKLTRSLKELDMSRCLDQIVVIDDDLHNRVLVREVLQLDHTFPPERVVQIADLSVASSFLQRADLANMGGIFDLNLTPHGSEGLLLAELALARQMRLLMLFTNDPRFVPVAWKNAHPSVPVVDKELICLSEVLKKWFK